jgi:hypothetical protein
MTSSRARVVGTALLFLIAIAPTLQAQNEDGTAAVPAPVVVDGVTINGPPPPELPETLARDPQGRVTIRAARDRWPARRRRVFAGAAVERVSSDQSAAGRARH